MRIVFVDLGRYQDSESVDTIEKLIINTGSKIVSIGNIPKDSCLRTYVLDSIERGSDIVSESCCIIDWLARCESMILGTRQYKLSIPKESPEFWYENLRYVVIGPTEHRASVLSGHFADIPEGKITSRYAKKIHDILMYEVK